MTATVIVQPEAEADMAEAFAWYERRVSGLGHDFLTEVDRAIERIADAPLLAAAIHRDARRAIPRRFPYAIYYILRGETVFVIAVLHQRRNPSLVRARSADLRDE